MGPVKVKIFEYAEVLLAMEIRNLAKRLTLALCVAALWPAVLLARPVIGINTDVSGDDREGRIMLGHSYVDAITSAGGIPLLLPPVENDPEAIKRYVAMCDGFLFTGGRDISPQRYNSDTTHPAINLLNPRRENFDFALMDAAVKSGKPVLGVCLGAQELNVAFGGSMIADLPTQTSSTINHKPGNGQLSHEVEITTGTRLHNLLSTTTLQVNSIHHQACDRLGQGLMVMAKAPDGVIEAFESEQHDFVVGVQWHPELLTEVPEHLAVYKALVEAAGAK
jgi:putative glutamine amidotransferase